MPIEILDVKEFPYGIKQINARMIFPKHKKKVEMLITVQFPLSFLLTTENSKFGEKVIRFFVSNLGPATTKYVETKKDGGQELRAEWYNISKEIFTQLQLERMFFKQSVLGSKIEMR